ncbi:MAG: dihydropteroate synthase [Prevotella sp.]|nr:dihydropteroate synthase [Prevotella sp.]
MSYSLYIHGRLLDLERPRVMGILNVTSDSFFAESRKQTEADIAERVRQMAEDGADIIDVGALSTRPGADMVSEQEEMERLRLALPIVRREAPDTPLSVDTFRPAVARRAVEELGADMINDVSGGNAQGAFGGTEPIETEDNPEMFRMVARLKVPYILMSTQRDIRSMLLTFARQVQQLRDLGQKDIVLDPGFGFGKTLEENYAVMQQLQLLQLLELPVLAGVSRKSMIYKLLDTTPEAALNGTTVLNTLALERGASILRVHDVREAVECIRILQGIKSKIENQ